mgnify:CR=1 FL=1
MPHDAIQYGKPTSFSKHALEGRQLRPAEEAQAKLVASRQRAHTCGGAGEDEVAGEQRRERRDVAELEGHVEYHLRQMHSARCESTCCTGACGQSRALCTASEVAVAGRGVC